MDINDNYNNHELLRLKLINLPISCYDYILSISSNTSILTRINYANDLNVFFDYINKTKSFNKTEVSEYTIDEIKSINSYDIEKYLDYLSNYTKNNRIYTNNNNGKKRKMCAVRAYYSYLIKHKLLVENPTSLVDVPKIKSKPIIRLTSQEIKLLLSVVESGEGLSKRELSYHKKTVLRDKAIISLLLGTGIRLSECLGINIHDVNLKNNSFRVSRKGGNQAILYFSDEVKSILMPYLVERSKMEVMPEHKDALFLSMQKKRLSKKALENIVNKYTKIITPLKNISPHKLRSTYGTQLYKNSGDIYLVAEVLGHKDVNTTKKHYAAMSEDKLKAAAEIVKLE